MLCLVAQSCLTLCDPINCSWPGSSAHRVFQARILEWIAVASSRTHIKLTLKMHSGIHQVWTVSSDSTYMRYLELSNWQHQKVHWQMLGVRGMDENRDWDLVFNGDRVSAQEGEKFRRWTIVGFTQQYEYTQCH